MHLVVLFVFNGCIILHWYLYVYIYIYVFYYIIYICLFLPAYDDPIWRIYISIYILFSGGLKPPSSMAIKPEGASFFLYHCIELYWYIYIYILYIYIYIHIDTVSLVSLCKACIAQNRVVRLSCSLLEVFKPTYCKHHRIFRRYLRSVFLTHLPNNGGKKTWKRSTHHFIDGVPAAFGWWSWWARVTFSSINCLASRTSMNITRVATTHSMATRISVWIGWYRYSQKKMVKQGNWDKTGWRSGGRLLCSML